MIQRKWEIVKTVKLLKGEKTESVVDKELQADKLENIAKREENKATEGGGIKRINAGSKEHH